MNINKNLFKNGKEVFMKKRHKQKRKGGVYAKKQKTIVFSSKQKNEDNIFLL